MFLFMLLDLFLTHAIHTIVPVLLKSIRESSDAATNISKQIEFSFTNLLIDILQACDRNAHSKRCFWMLFQVREGVKKI